MEMYIHEAKTKLSQLVRAMEAGEKVVISRAGQPVAQLVPVTKVKKQSKRKLGQLKGRLIVPENFNDPLPDAFWMGEDLQ